MWNADKAISSPLLTAALLTMHSTGTCSNGWKSSVYINVAILSNAANSSGQIHLYASGREGHDLCMPLTKVVNTNAAIFLELLVTLHCTGSTLNTTFGAHTYGGQKQCPCM
jgi:hypothetical protein|uniref:Secreted protein n=1 Tax=Eutreptiella gymnastica TaxID=73025 RepID=A0A7S4FUY3_9EUGL